MRFTLPKVTRAILALLVVVSVVWQVSAARRAGLGLDFRKSTLVPWVSLTPQTSWKYPWVYITATFAEQNLFTLGVAAAWFYFGGKYLERAWGEQELGRFIALLTILPTLITSLLYLAAYGLTRSSNLLYVLGRIVHLLKYLLTVLGTPQYKALLPYKQAFSLRSSSSSQNTPSACFEAPSESVSNTFPPSSSLPTPSLASSSLQTQLLS